MSISLRFHFTPPCVFFFPLLYYAPFPLSCPLAFPYLSFHSPLHATLHFTFMQNPICVSLSTELQQNPQLHFHHILYITFLPSPHYILIQNTLHQNTLCISYLLILYTMIQFSATAQYNSRNYKTGEGSACRVHWVWFLSHAEAQRAQSGRLGAKLRRPDHSIGFRFPAFYRRWPGEPRLVIPSSGTVRTRG